MAISGYSGYEIIWGEGFEKSLIRLRLTWRQWEELGGRAGIEAVLAVNPYEEGTTEMEGTGGHRYLPTGDRAPDLPELLVAYYVDSIKHEVHVVGANPFWGEDALQRP